MDGTEGSLSKFDEELLQTMPISNIIIYTLTSFDIDKFLESGEAKETKYDLENMLNFEASILPKHTGEPHKETRLRMKDSFGDGDVE